MKKKMKSQYDEAWIIEGIFHTLYMVGIICDRDGINLDDYKQARTKIDEAIQVVGAYTKIHKSVSAYRMFRSSGTKDSLRTFSPAKQIELPFTETKTA